MDELWGLTMRANSGDEFKGTLGMNPGDELLWVGCNISGNKVPSALFNFASLLGNPFSKISLLSLLAKSSMIILL